ncbi:MAG: FAD-binding oxidoreductase [Bradyrhizobiaceae bacterium]|nr:FAD-binding oxidoreductase [Bradyrhizobiaceae bacterium]
MSNPTVDTPRSTTSRLYPIEAFLADIGDIPASVEPTELKRKSRDFFWFSPILGPMLKNKFADVIITPRDEADVLCVASACARHCIPLTVRGGATGNYGQCVPLEGGVVLDVSRLGTVDWVRPGVVRVGAGAKMDWLDRELSPYGYEQRIHPSTKRSATVGGFVAGGSGGVGSVTYGGMREPGNILAARVVSLEREPRVIELRGDAAQKINRAYGTTGIITALEMPVSPVLPWIDVIIAFDDFLDAVRYGQKVALGDGIVKKLLSIVAWPLPRYFGALRRYCPEGRHLLIGMIAEASLETCKTLLDAARGEITFEGRSDDSPGQVPLYEYTWGHTTLQVLKSDRTAAYLQCLFPGDRLVQSVRDANVRFGDELMQHLEFIRFGGAVTASALPVVRYTTPQRLNQIIAEHEAAGIMVANPHVYTLEDGSRHKRVDADQLGFKHEIDPLGLLNPGKMRSFVPRLPGASQ